MKTPQIKSKKRALAIFFGVLALSFVFARPAFAAGGVSAAIVTVISWIATGAAYVLGYFLTLVLDVLVIIAQYNRFTTAEPIVVGWVIVRDLCNMFFVLILLIIAFATILRREDYSAKRWLPKLLIMAVLINFSKTISGLIIDFSQVIMLTFVNAFASNGASNFVSMFQINKYLSMPFADKADAFAQTDDNNLLFSTLLGLVAGVVALLITLIISIALLTSLAMRIVMLWVYVILSPLAYLMAAFPAGQKYSGQWWSSFSKEVIGGPVLAFFIWLALVTVSTTNIGLTDFNANSAATSNGKPQVSAGTDLFTSNNFSTYIITIAMLMGGLIVTQQIGGAAGKSAGKAMTRIQKGQAMAWGGTKTAADWLNIRQGKRTGIDLNMKRNFESVKVSLAARKTDDVSKVRQSAKRNLETGGMLGAATGWSAVGWTDNYLRLSGIKKAVGGAFGRKDRLKARGDKLTEEIGAMEVGGAAWSAKTKKLQSEALRPEIESVSKAMAEKTKEINELAAKGGNTSQLVKEHADLQDQHDSLVGQKHAKEKEIEMNRAVQYQKLRENGLIYDDDDSLQAEKAKKIEKANKLNEAFAFYRVQDNEGSNAERAAISKMGQNITSQNEDELIVQFDSALANNNHNLAAAIAKQIAKVGGMNALLRGKGYNDKAGLSTAEIEKMRSDLKAQGREADFDKVYQSERGFNDFMRDVFGKRLKMNEQSYLTLQNDMSELNPNHGYMEKTVGVNSYGKLQQESGLSRSKVVVGERNKGEVENAVRNRGRLWYGDENSGHFEFNAEGLTFIAANWQSYLKELTGGKRINPSALASFVQDHAQDQLKSALKKVVDAGGMGQKDYDTFFKELVELGKSKDKTFRDNIQDKIFSEMENEKNNA